MALMNSSGPSERAPVSGSWEAWALNLAFVWVDTCTGSSEPMRLSLTASLTVTAEDMVGVVPQEQWVVTKVENDWGG